MINNLFLNIDAGTVDWSRAQFALTAIYHWLFVPLTLGLAVIMGIVETKYYRTKDEFWKNAAQFWQKLFGINFAMGVATGIILEFEFGTNWSNYSWFVGDIFGAPLAIEGIVAFFMESTFVAVMFFGWRKVSPGFHLASTWLTGLGATISAWWILVANAWMQYPIGCVDPRGQRLDAISHRLRVQSRHHAQRDGILRPSGPLTFRHRQVLPHRHLLVDHRRHLLRGRLLLVSHEEPSHEACH